MSDSSTPDSKPYPNDISDAQWALLEPFVRAHEGGPQPVLYSRREVVNAILYITHTGAQWRHMPHDLPDWQLVYHYFRKWTNTMLCAARSAKPRVERSNPRRRFSTARR